jgi:hypothetical protein
MYLPFSENWPVPLAGNYEKSWWPEQALSDAYRDKLAAYFAAFARHIRDRGWDRTEFQFYLNNKVYYREKFAGSSAPWIFDEPVNIQDFAALKWYGDLWYGAVDPVKGQTRQVFRCDISFTQYGRDILWGVSDIDYLGGNNPQKTRMKHEEMVRHPGTRFAEYGTANDLLDANTQPVLWQLSAWAKGAVRVLPWQTICSADCWEKGEQTALFYPGEFYPGDPGEFYPGQGSEPGAPGAQGADANVEGTENTERVEDRVYPSIRLKAFRQGQQLIEYLVLLAKTKNVSENTIRHWLTNYLTRQGLQETTVKTHQHDAGTPAYKNMTIPDIYHLRFLVGSDLDN